MVLLLIPFIYSGGGGGGTQIIADPVHLKLFVVIVTIIQNNWQKDLWT